MSGNHRPNDPCGTWTDWHTTEPCEECRIRGARPEPVLVAPYTPHETTMLPNQRRELVRILGSSYPISALANLTDRQLHEQWLADCEYPNGVAHLSAEGKS